MGHEERISDERLQKKLLVSKIMNGKRCQGGQKQRWHDLIHADLKQLNMVADWRTAAREKTMAQQHQQTPSRAQRTKRIR